MDYNTILDVSLDIGYQLAMSGAETYRVEESVIHVLNSYQIPCEVYAITNFLMVTITTNTGESITRMRRIGPHGNNLDAVEKLNALSRRICSSHPEPSEAAAWMEEVKRTALYYRFPVLLFGDFLGGMGFAILFGSNYTDMLIAGICGVIIGVINRLMEKLKANLFFCTIASSFCMALTAYTLNTVGIVKNADAVNIGALMILVPGLLFTNALRDMIYGDTNSGINRFVQVLMIAAAIAIGTATAWNLVSAVIQTPVSAAEQAYSLPIQCLAAYIGCVGFSLLFNIHGHGGIYCAIGGVVTWAVFVLSQRAGATELMGYFWGTAFAASYAEIMARIRKYPTISYLVVSIFPLIPGAGVYYTMLYALHNEMGRFAVQGTKTAATAGIMAIAILLVSTAVKIITNSGMNRK